MNENVLDEGLDQEVTGYDGAKYTLAKLRKTANLFAANNPDIAKVKEKHSKVYNCTADKVPPEILKEVYGLDENFKEEWEPDPSYSNPKEYEVSNLGRIKHFGKIMLQDDARDENGKESKGYLVMTKCSDENDKRNFNKSDYVYNYVARAFLNKKEGDGYQVHHKDNNGYDCRPENLILLKPREHSKAHGFFVTGDKSDN